MFQRDNPRDGVCGIPKLEAHTMSDKKSVVVSLHDVSPLTWSTADTMIGELAACGITRTSLLVVPDHHHRGHFLNDAGFCEWLRRNVSEGHEAVIHGYFHLRDRRANESLRDRLTTRIYTEDEGEFYDIEEDKAFALVTRAQEEFAQAGLSPSGFIAPAWLLSEGGERALKRAGIRYTTKLTNVSDLSSGETLATQSMVYSVRTSWRRVASLGWNAFLYARLQANPLLRIGIHPPDRSHPSIWGQILRCANSAATQREVVTYGNWIDRRGRNDPEDHVAPR
jgi:predicted deacetylase